MSWLSQVTHYTASSPSIRRWQKRLFLILALGYSIELFNSLYLVAFTGIQLHYMMMVLFHVFFGFLLIVFLLSYIAGHVITAQHKHNTKSIRIGLTTFFLLGICFVLGVYLTYVGVPRDNIWKLYLHIATGLAAPLIFVFHIKTISKGQRPDWTMTFRKGLTIGGAGILSIISLLYFSIKIAPETLGAVDRDLAVLSYDEHSNPFFPSLATTEDGGTIPAKALADSQSCGTSGCHSDIYDQWESSAHRFSSFNNPFYSRAVEYMGERVGFPPTKFCGGCHDPLVMFPGMMDEAVDTTSWEANAGITCITCHSIVQIRDLRGNGNYVIEAPKRYPFAQSSNAVLQKINRLLVRVKPGPHRETFLKDIHTQTEFCMLCHKVHIPQQVNHYRWLRGQDEYDNWQDSGVSGFSARSFYYPPEPKRCQQCHMPEVVSEDMGQQGGKIRTHRFLGPNTALPSIRGDKRHLEELEKFLKEDKVSVDIFALRPHQGGSSGQWIAPLGTFNGTVISDQPVDLEIVVRNRGVGHTFPGGTNDSNEVWVELKVEDNRGRTLYWSGHIDEEGYVDKKAHFYKAVLLDRESQIINKRNVHDWVSTLYARTIKPGTADAVHYRFTLPSDHAGKITITAKVQYRKFNRWFTNWVFAGMRDPLQVSFRNDDYVDTGTWVFNNNPVPNLPIVTMAEDTVTLEVIKAEKDNENKMRISNRSTVPVSNQIPVLRERFNDYGIGLLLQGDTKGADAAFRKVVELDPSYVDGYINIARSQLKEGNLQDAEKMLNKALRLDPGFLKTRYFLGLIYIDYGQYNKAIKELSAVAKKYPKDRVVRNNLGKAYFLDGQYDMAIQEFEQCLVVDPENVEAHYNMMLSYNALGKTEEAQMAMQNYERYKKDENAAAVTARYRREHPEDNLEAQPIHLHQ